MCDNRASGVQDVLLNKLDMAAAVAMHGAELATSMASACAEPRSGMNRFTAHVDLGSLLYWQLCKACQRHSSCIGTAVSTASSHTSTSAACSTK